jgi:hypothetical protein
MISPELVIRIRSLFYAEHWKIGTIAAELGLHAETVRNALETDRFNRPRMMRNTKLDPYMDLSASRWSSIRGCVPRGFTR